MPATLVRNRSTTPLPLSLPLRGVLRGGQAITVKLAADLGPTGDAIELRALPDTYAGPYDTAYLAPSAMRALGLADAAEEVLAALGLTDLAARELAAGGGLDLDGDGKVAVSVADLIAAENSLLAVDEDGKLLVDTDALGALLGDVGGGSSYELNIAVTTPVADTRRVVVTVTRDDEPAQFCAIRVDLMTNLADLSGLSFTDETFVHVKRQTTRIGTANAGVELIGQTNEDGEFAFTLNATGIALAGHVVAIVGDASASVMGS